MNSLDNIINEELKDDDIGKYLKYELDRQNKGLELIASENYPSNKVRIAMASIACAKYAEGYPGKRYYGGCEFIDKIEQEAINRACQLFNCHYANVQPHSGSQANAAAYRALEVTLQKEGKLVNRKMRILSADLNSGGHLTHGSPVSFSSHLYDVYFYSLDSSGRLDMNLVESAIKQYNPDVLLTGFSAYPYQIDFSKFKELADKYNCKLIVDMAHIAGLVAAGMHQNPCDYADIVTTTTHKTLRGPRGGLILTNDDELIKKINSATFPYYQGGPLEHIIAAKAICFKEAMADDFKIYAKNIINNTKAFTNKMIELGATCSDTENHLMLLNTKLSFNLTGLDAQTLLEDINITTNKNMIQNDSESPRTTSGLRIGFAALTTRGCDINIAENIAEIIYNYLSKKLSKEDAIIKVNNIVKLLKDVREI